jgi:hypothetical protein
MPRFLALYMGSQDSEAQRRWNALTDAERAERSKSAMAAWGGWVEKHKNAIVDIGSPLGKTLLADPAGIHRYKNTVAAYVIVEAPSHDAAASLFENHPHFAIFPGTSVEIMECLPLPSS